MGWFAGLDWGGASHAVAVVDERGRLVDQFTVAHSADGLVELERRLAKLAPPALIPIAIERPSGLLVDRLVEAGHPVVPIHPNVVKACRPRYRAAPGKSDPGDAHMLADILRTDGHRFRALTPTADAIRALQALVRGRDDLVSERVALGNRLQALLDGFWPGAAAIGACPSAAQGADRGADLTSPIALAFLKRYPTPKSAARLGEKRLAAFLTRQAYCGRRTPADLLGRLRQAPDGRAGDAESKAKGELVSALTRVLATLGRQLKKLTAAIEQHVASLPDGRIIMSFPRAGRICAAQILAEIGDVRERFPTNDQLGHRPLPWHHGTSPLPRPTTPRAPFLGGWAGEWAGAV